MFPRECAKPPTHGGARNKLQLNGTRARNIEWENGPGGCRLEWGAQFVRTHDNVWQSQSVAAHVMTTPTPRHSAPATAHRRGAGTGGAQGEVPRGAGAHPDTPRLQIQTRRSVPAVPDGAEGPRDRKTLRAGVRVVCSAGARDGGTAGKTRHGASTTAAGDKGNNGGHRGRGGARTCDFLPPFEV